MENYGNNGIFICGNFYSETLKSQTTGNVSITREPKRKIRRLAAMLRNYRVYHRYIGLLLSLFLLISSLTGILLSWKKDVALLMPPTQKEGATDLSQWIPLSSIAQKAGMALDSAQNIPSNPIDRIDVRPDKGIVKVLFQEGYWEVQLNGSTGEVLSVGRRHSDWLESLHDGSIISDGFKLVSMNLLGLGLLILIASGVILWLYPKRIRQLKK